MPSPLRPSGARRSRSTTTSDPEPGVRRAPAGPTRAARPPVERRRHARSHVPARGRPRRRGDLAVTSAASASGRSSAWASCLGARRPRPGGWADLALGTLCALAGTYLCLVLLLLVSRLPWLEREVGHDRIVGLHRRVAPYALALVLAHVVLTTVSYAESGRSSFLGELGTSSPRPRG